MRTILRMRSAALGLALVAALTSAPGCGSSDDIWITGTLLKGGAPLACPPNRTMNITLLAVDVKGEDGKPVSAGEPYPARVNEADGSFVVPGPDGKGIPKGRYRVSLIQRPTAAAVRETREKSGKAKPISRETDFFKNQFNGETSPIVRDLNSSSKLTIDLDHPTAEHVDTLR